MRRAVLLLLLVAAGLAWWWTRGREARAPQRGPGPGEGGVAESRRGHDGAALRRTEGATDIVEIDLYGTPQKLYLGDIESDDTDDELRRVVARATRGKGEYDMHLARAAREVAYQSALLDVALPGAAVDFILRSHGAPDHSVARVVLATNASDGATDGVDGAIRTAIDDHLGGRGDLRIGVGEIATPGEAHSRRLVVLAARRQVQLEPLRRSIDLGASWRVSGTTSWSDLSATALLPDGELRRLEIETTDERFSVQVPAMSTPGEVHLSIDGIGPAGPGKLVQVTGEVGRPIPRSYQAAVFSDEEFADAEHAEAYAMELINGDREALGLPPLALDPALSAVARAHSEEMAALGFFAHASPNTGLVGDRLRAARYRSSAHGENLALNESVSAAHFSLMGSIGHRANLVSERFDRAGVGIAWRGDEGKSYYLTQVFARHAARIDAEQVAAQVLERLNRARAEADLPELRSDEELRHVAEEAAEHSLGATDPESAMEVIRGRDLRRSVAISAAIVYDAGEIEAPAALEDEVYSRVGVGIAQSDASEQVAIAAVILLSR